MRLTVLNVAYPFAPVGPDAVGGAEQVLTQLDRALAREGHRSLVVAPEGSRTFGRLLPVPVPAATVDDRVRAETHARVRQLIRDACARWSVDVVHLHGLDFPAYRPEPGVPALATLHLPPSWYPASAFTTWRADTHLCCVSESQRAACPPSALPVLTIANGVEMDPAPATDGRGESVVALGRVCPEKGFHLALDAADLAGVPLLLAGRVFPYAEHQRYFREQLQSRFEHGRHTFIGPVGVAEKRRLLRSGRCLLVPSLAPETSSLVAMEALASGTPVVAFRAGALREIVEDGVTGYLVESVVEMAEAIARAGQIKSWICRERAQERFSVERTARAYLDLYARLAEHRTSAAERQESAA